MKPGGAPLRRTAAACATAQPKRQASRGARAARSRFHRWMPLRNIFGLLCCSNHAYKRRHLCQECSHGIGGIAGIRLPVGCPHAQLHHLLRCKGVVDMHDVDGPRGVEAEDAAEQSRIAFDQVDLLMAGRCSGEVRLAHRFDPCHRQRTDHGGGRQRGCAWIEERLEAAQASTRLTGTTRTYPVSEEFE